jgi:pyruvate/2-oxoglutarate dehydrogenase complex dihydrolipoamide dehydrogenase (E3) component
MTEVLTPDICVIGGGSGGLSVAAAAAAFRVPVVLIEHGKMGGECLNTGCVPSKSLIAAAKHARAIAQARAFGLSARGLDIDFGKVHRRIHDVIAAIAPNDSKERFTGLRVRVIQGTARFADAETVRVGDGIAIKARRFVIATGSVPSLPPIEGLKETPHLTSETIFDLTTRPEHLIVIGAGAIGLELAQAFRRLGAAVTVLDAAQPLAREDPECARVVLDALADEGVDVRGNVAVARVEKVDGKIKVVLRGKDGEHIISGSHLLVATGRRANAEGLDLERAGIAHDGAGILVDRGLRTANKRVYAIGDVAGGAQFTHLANYHAGLIMRNVLFRLPVRVNEQLVPRVTFTDPELAQVGYTEAQAQHRRYSIQVLRWPYWENDRAQTETETRGHIKVIITRGGRILGATIVGSQAGELISAWSLAISQNLNIRAFTGVVLPYPTRAEIGKRAALNYFLPGTTNALVQRIIVLLRRFG